MSPERIMRRPSRSNSRGRKRGTASPARRNASKSPSRSKTSKLRSGPAKSPSTKPIIRKGSAKSATVTKSSAEMSSPPKSLVRKAIPEKSHPASKSPSRATKRTPSKPRLVSKSSEKPKQSARSRSESRCGNSKDEPKAEPKLATIPTPTPARIFEPIQKSTVVPKHFESSLSQPFSNTPFHTLPHGTAATHEPSREMIVRHRVPSFDYRPFVSKLPPPQKVANYKKRARVHFRRYGRFYIIVLMLAVIALVLYHFGHGVQKTLKQLCTELNTYISNVKKQ